jgi:hypothetical protein
MELLNQIAQPVLLIVLPALAIALTSWAYKAYQVERAKLNEKQLTLLDRIIETGIWAAEQAYKAGIIPKEARLQYVIKFAQTYCDNHHIAVNVEELAVRIHAAVGKSLNAQKILQ